VVFINLTSPESRGASIALLNFVNCLGRGFGPAVVEMWMDYSRLDRRDAMSSMLNLWLLAGSVLCVASLSIVADEDKLKQSLHKLAEQSISHSKSLTSLSTLHSAGTAGYSAVLIGGATGPVPGAKESSSTTSSSSSIAHSGNAVPSVSLGVGAV
jgi:hypothetical protein